MPNSLHSGLSRRAAFALNTSFFLLGLQGAAYSSMLLLLALRLPIGPWPLALLILLIFGAVVAWMTHRAGWRPLLPALLALCLTVASVLLNGWVYDSSFDGQGYHQLAIWSLQHGWNPLYEPRFDDSLWVMHYPKAAWLTGASAGLLSGMTDTGKSLNLIAICASFLSAFAFLCRLLERMEGRRNQATDGAALSLRGLPAIAWLVAAAAACNPVTLIQLFTHYNDGLIGSLLLTLLASLGYYALQADRRALASSSVCIVLLINIKFTVIAYAGLICLFFLGYLALLELKRPERSSGGQKRWKQLWSPDSRLKAPLLFLGAVGIAAVAVFGYNPYLTNWISHGHPLYPLAGPGKLDIMTLNSPADFIGKNRLEKFILSYTAKTEDPITPWESRRASIWKPGLGAFLKMEVDTRTGGFGPLTLWLFIGSMGLGALMLALDPRRTAAGAWIAAALLATVFINPECWWARYVPQLWLLPLVLVVTAALSMRRLLRIGAWALLLVALVNATGAGGISAARQMFKSLMIHEQYESLQAAEEAPLRVLTEGISSIEYRLQTYGIPYELVSREELCGQPQRFYYTIGSYCTESME
ncbi:hypothetical protein [Paenibacillus puerhi]|uniref:hypothetical protein n=1 Tax=Paenibacillus puerhi TaxID=2692622 RepID=UPI00135ACC0C|nr:hypothetical protein [Paenibacillus puerhi]